MASPSKRKPAKQKSRMMPEVVKKIKVTKTVRKDLSSASKKKKLDYMC